jgi:hypothetical protein
MSQILETLVSLGLPSAVVAMVLIALIFKRDHAQVSMWAGWSAIGLVGVMGVAQLVEVSRGEISVDVTPGNVYAFDMSGQPVALEVAVTRAGSTIETFTVDKIPEGQYSSRRLSLGTGDDGLSVRFQERKIGRLTSGQLSDAGWRSATDCDNRDEGQPKFWATNRVHVGQSHKLGRTPYGMLKLVAKRFTGDGKAVVTLHLEGHQEPLPQQLEIANKGLGVQSFAEVPEFYIAVREADFTVDPPWAAFSVFSRQ